MYLEVDKVSKSYGALRVLQELSFRLAQGRIGCLLGPSGCGKTTLLRCIAGFESIDQGEICAAGSTLSRPDLSVAPEARRIGMVFQDYALFPHLTVGRNVGFGLHRLPGAQRRARVEEVLAIVGLADIRHRYPHELSGGQQQRVALARAMAPNPGLLLLDEPFSNLDIALRERLVIEVRDILKAQGATALLVTHDQKEAFAMADEVGVMSDGRLQQWDTPYNLYHRPCNRFVADFVGEGAFLPGTVVAGGQVRVEVGVLPGDMIHALPEGAEVEVLLRPDDIVHDDTSALTAEVCSKAFRGAGILYTLQLPSGAHVLSLVASHHDHRVGERIGVTLATDHVVAFERVN